MACISQLSTTLHLNLHEKFTDFVLVCFGWKSPLGSSFSASVPCRASSPLRQQNSANEPIRQSANRGTEEDCKYKTTGPCYINKQLTQFNIHEYSFSSNAQSAGNKAFRRFMEGAHKYTGIRVPQSFYIWTKISYNARIHFQLWDQDP